MKRGHVPMLAALVLGCTPAVPPRPAAPPAPHLHLTPLADLAPAAGLHWLVDVDPRQLLGQPEVIAALSGVVSEADFDARARVLGGVDVRSATALVVGGYATSTLFLAAQMVDPARVEAAFAAQVADVEGRAIDQGSASVSVVRVWGASGKDHESVVVFGRQAAGLCLGSDAPLRAAELFAMDKLKRSRPAWRVPPLDRLAELLGDAPLRAAAPGPFVGEWGLGLGGLLASATGAGAAATVEGDAVRIRAVITGTWGDRAVEAEGRLERAYGLLGATGLGRLLELDRPVAPPVFSATRESLGFELRLRLRPLFVGLRDATATEVHEIMGVSDHPIL